MNDRKYMFRGKRYDNKNWVYGDLICIADGRRFIVNNKFGACIDENGNFINTGSPFCCEVSPITVGQFIGVLDKKGHPLFEGDVVEIIGEDPLFEVTYDKKTARYVFISTFIEVDFDNYSPNDMVRMGNLFDEPDILLCDSQSP